MHIGQKIKELRNLKLWTQAKLAEIANVSERTIRRLEAGENTEKETLLLVLEALGTNLEEIGSMFNNDDTIKEESKEKFTDIKFLKRIEYGRELVRIITSAHQFGYDYHDCTTDDQINKAQEFLSIVADVLGIWDMIEIGQRFDLENDLSNLIKELEKMGLWVFGDRQVDNNNWVTTIVEIYSKDNPLIQKIKLDKDMVQKANNISAIINKNKSPLNE
ncbi:helix-turn-helix transcriptional regulator [Lysinibacillus sp. FSL K6-0232]|uniref:helix-turn-helix transcriptional regulator n=1 Tax=unclassified Lysinibacillus TaxID=2636778 RepID=UPI0030FA7007